LTSTILSVVTDATFVVVVSLCGRYAAAVVSSTTLLLQCQLYSNVCGDVTYTSRSNDYSLGLFYRHSPTYAVSRYANSDLRNLKKKKTKTNSKYKTYETRTEYFLVEWKRSEMKVTEEYYWTITQAAGR